MGALQANIEVLSAGWREVLQGEEIQGLLANLESFLRQERAEHEIYPREGDVFRALALCPLERVRVVILGQDPYINPGQAQGLAFSVPAGEALPPSLGNIFAEIARECDVELRTRGDLQDWAEQGVLLLNSTLTVRRGASFSHASKGWEQVTDTIISATAQRARGIVYLLWGRHAQSKRRLITGRQHLVLCAAHPSPLSARRGFFGCGHFTMVNKFLREHGEGPIVW